MILFLKISYFFTQNTAVIHLWKTRNKNYSSWECTVLYTRYEKGDILGNVKLYDIILPSFVLCTLGLDNFKTKAALNLRYFTYKYSVLNPSKNDIFASLHLYELLNKKQILFTLVDTKTKLCCLILKPYTGKREWNFKTKYKYN